MYLRCRFCHERVFFLKHRAHEHAHVRHRADGQMVQYITLPPDERLELDLTGVPRWFYHPKCGRTTGMPEEIIRSYLVNPFLYNGRTYCSGCGTHLPQGEFVWTETGEDLDSYNKRLQQSAPWIVKMLGGRAPKVPLFGWIVARVGGPARARWLAEEAEVLEDFDEEPVG